MMVNPADTNGLQYQTDLVIGGLATRHARRFSSRQREAVVAGDARLDWATLDERVNHLADALTQHGVGHGTVVGLYMRNRAEFFEIVLALAALGAVAAPQSFRSTPHELTHGLQATGAQLLFTEEGDLAERSVAALTGMADAPRLIVVGAVGVVTDYLGEPDGAGAVIPEPPGEHDTIWIASTGGTSGPPKLVRVPHRVLVQMWLYMAIEFEIGRSDTMLIPGPLHHGLGFGFALQQLYVGGRVVVLGDFDAGTALAAIAREQVTVVPAAPTILNMLLDHPDCAATDLSSVRTIISAGSPLTSATKLRLLDRLADVQLYEHYGATEAGFFTVLGPEDQLRKERSCGEAFFGSEIRVADNGRACAPGEIGMVYKRGLVQGGGYLGNAEATAQMFRDGWATVGDVGYLDDEGYLYLVDRQSDIIVSGGVNVYPAEIEATIASLEGVSAVAVIGVPDERWGESVKAFVVRRPGAVLEADDVVAACTALLASYKRPRHVEFVDELPTSAAGKIVKRELRAAAWSGHQRSVG